MFFNTTKIAFDKKYGYGDFKYCIMSAQLCYIQLY